MAPVTSVPPIATCQFCGKEFVPRRWWSKFCSGRCRTRDHFLNNYGSTNTRKLIRDGEYVPKPRKNGGNSK